MKAFKTPLLILLILLCRIVPLYGQTVQDCPCAIPICQTTYTELNAYSGQGTLPNEINKIISCLGQGEKNDVWYVFTVQSSGLLNFSITPNVIADDYDWAVYNLSAANCVDIFSNPSLEVSCNYAGIGGITGPNGLPGLQNEPPIPVLIGETYVINVSQFSVSPNGYTIDFGQSTASILDVTPPAIDSVNTNFVCGQDSFQVTFTENIQCSSVQIADFVLTDPQGTPLTITSVTSPNCGSVCGYARTFIFKFTPGANFLGTYTLDIVSNIDDVCANSCLIPTTIAFNVSSYTYNNVVNNVTCPGGSNGSISVSVTAPPGPYTYLWSNGNTTTNPTGLSPGTYTVTVSKNGSCSDITTFNVLGVAAWAYSTASSNSACGAATGSASVNVTAGGTSPYTYSWSSGATTSTAASLSAGTYTVTVTDVNSCTVTATVAVNQTSGVTASIPANVNVNCFGAATGTATSSGSNGSGGYAYLWSNGQTLATATGLAAGTYTVTVTDNLGGCSSTATIIITQPPTAVSGVSNSNPTKCGLPNGLAYVTGNGGTGPYTFVWSNGTSNDSTSLVAAGTYTVTITDSKGCTGTITAQVAASSAVTATIPNSVNVGCNGGNNGTATGGCTSCTGAITYLWSNGQTTQTATGLIAATYTITVTDANNCTSSTTVVIGQPTALSVTNAINDTICLTQLSAITAAGGGGTAPYGFLWSNGSTNALLAVSPAITTTYTVTVTDSKTCTATKSVTVYVKPALSVTASNDTTICSGSGVTVSCVASGGDNTYSYSWNNGLNSASSFAINPLNDTTLIIKLTDNCGSPAVYDTVHIYIIPTMALNFPVVSNVSCNSGSDGSAQVNIGGGIPVFIYAWSNGQTTATATGLVAGTYTVTVTDGNTCTASATVVINQPTALSITGMPAVTICLSQNTTITPVYSGGTPSYTYAWSGGQTTDSITVSPGSTATYTVTVTDSKLCTLSQSVTVTVNPALSVVASNDTIICNGDDVIVSAVSGGGNGIYSLSWNNGLGNGSPLNFVPAGDTTLVVQLTDNCGSPAVYDTIHISVVPQLVLNVTGIKDVSCFGGNDGSATINITGGALPFSYLWSDGKTIATNNQLSATTYTVTVTDNKGCSATITLTIIEPPKLTINAFVTDTICIGEQSSFVTLPVGGTFPYTYLWSDGSTKANINVSPAVSTSYTVTVTDSKNCTATSVASVMVRPPLQITFISPNATICKGKPITLSIALGGGNGNYSYSFNNGPFLPNSSITFTVTGDTMIIVTGKDGCTTPRVTDSISVKAIDAPIVDFSWNPDSGCQPLTVAFYDSSVAFNGSTRLWEFGDGYSSPLMNPVHVYKDFGVFDVTLTVTTPQGCETRLVNPAIIEVYEKPVAYFDFAPKKPTLYFSTVQFYDESSGNPNQWIWDFGDNGLLSYLQNPSHEYQDTGRYIVSLTVTNEHGCTDSIYFIVEVRDEYAFYIPSAFTPNGDGKNDQFVITGINYNHFVQKIFDRWGQPVFESSNRNFWDGNDWTGKKAPAGNYVYKIEVYESTGKKHLYTGNVNLIR